MKPSRLHAEPVAFFTKLWNPTANQAEQLGYAYVDDENGTLISEASSGGANSAGQASYIYLPTVNGPMLIAAVINGATYAVHSDHLNRRANSATTAGKPSGSGATARFGEDKATIAKNRFANLDITPNPGTTSLSEVKFNLRIRGSMRMKRVGSSTTTSGATTVGRALPPAGSDWAGWRVESVCVCKYQPTSVCRSW